MARKSKKNQSSGGFVPASYQGSYKPSHSVRAADVPEIGGPAQESMAQYSRSSAQYAGRRPKRKGVGGKIAIAVVIIVAIAVVAALGFYVYSEMRKAEINQDLHDNYSQEEMEAIDTELTGMTKFDEPFTILLLGSDARADDPDMGARTDTIILVRVDPIENVVNMVSIPRDTMIEIDGYGTQKFNAAYTYGGPSGTIAAVKELCDVDIDHYAEVNFEGLEGLVDAIGGIDIDVEDYIDDPEAGPAVLEPGEQHLDGEAALTYARSRKFIDGDFSRVRHQRQVIEAIIHRVMTAPAADLYGLIHASTSFLTTDTAMDVDFIFSLADQVRHNENALTLHTATLPATTTSVKGISYVVVDAGGVAAVMDEFMASGDVSFGEEETLEETEESAAAGSASGSASGASAASAA